MVLGKGRWAAPAATPLHAEIHTPDGRVVRGMARALVMFNAPAAADMQAFLLPDAQKPEVPVGSAVRLFLEDPRAPSARDAL
jgi:hypothetical protein